MKSLSSKDHNITPLHSPNNHLPHSSTMPTSSHLKTPSSSPHTSKLPTNSSSPSPQMDPFPNPPFSPYPPSYTKFNSALTAGLLNPMSPPPLPPPAAADNKSRASPTLFDMMSNEQDYHPTSSAAAISARDRQLLLNDRLADILAAPSPGNHFNDPLSGDVRLTLSSKDGLSVLLTVHRHILVAHSRFFAGKLSDRWSKQQRALPHLVEISDCDDIGVYVETLKLMYCRDVRHWLMREDVGKVLSFLKISAAIGFDAGVLSCLEYLEAAPWSEDEEERVASVLSQLDLECSGAGEVLKRVSLEVASSSAMEEGNGNGEEILLRLLRVVLEGKDEKARREMKGLVSKMLRENNSGRGGGGDVSRESLFAACASCLLFLRLHFLRAAAAASSDASEAGQIARQADNVCWMLDILIDRQIGDEFLRTWAAETELAEAHDRVPAVHRYEVSRITSRLFVGIGKGQILVSKEARCQLLRTWLEPFYKDFGWMRRACKGLDRHLVEDGLGNTILTLPLAMQQEILLAWFDRFLNSGDDCPNIQRGFEVWWRRAFWRRNGETSRPPQLRITASCENCS